MAHTVYNDGDGLKKYRKVRGNGDTTTPYEGYVVDQDLITATGTQAQTPASKSVLTSTGATPYSVIQLLKGILLEGGSGGTAAPAFLEFSTTTPVSVGTANTELLVVDCRGWNHLAVTIANTGTTAFSDFFVAMRTNTTAAWRQLTFTESDFTTNVSKNSGNMGLHLIDTSNFGGFGQAFLTMPASGSGWILMNVRGFSHVRFVATVAAGTTTATVFGNVE